MKITNKSSPSIKEGAACITYGGVPGDPGTSNQWCIIVSNGWTYNHGGGLPNVHRAVGGGWYVHAPLHDLLCVRFPSRRSIIAALKVSE